MNALYAPKSLTEHPRVACHDRVCVPDGRVGEVIGFYRRDEESVLVSFSVGAAAAFLTTEVSAL
jgi:hypothetical protein